MQGNRKKKFKVHAWYIGVLICVVFFIANIWQIRDTATSADGQSQGFFGFLERTMFDYRIRSRGTRAMSEKVGLLAIDEKSISKFGRWPFSRSAYVDALKNLKSAGVRWIGFDVIFSEPEKMTLQDALEPMQSILKVSVSPTGVLDPRRFAEGLSKLIEAAPADQAFAEAIAEFENIVQAYIFFPEDQAQGLEREWKEGREALNRNLVDIIEAKNQEPSVQGDVFALVNPSVILGPKPILGFINNEFDKDGLFRRYKLIQEIPGGKPNSEKKFVPSLGLQLAAKYLNKKISVISDESSERIALVDPSGQATSIPLTGANGTMLINHYGEHQIASNKSSPRIISLADAAENIIPKPVPDILILGSTTVGADDKRPSPLNPFANGVEHHLAAVENILRNDFLLRPMYYSLNELIFSLMGGLLLCLLLTRAGASVSLLILIASHALLEFIDRKFIFSNNHIINFGTFHLQNASIFLSMTLYKYFIEEREKREIKGAFQHYLNPAVINQVLESPDGLKLGGDKRELTVFFSDVRGFTSISEILSPEALAGLLNEYFTPMTRIVLDSGGLLDKYIGDALMAVWGAPLHTPDHADRALDSALKMLDALDELRSTWATRNLPAIDIGCGINTGPMVVGNMGSDLRFDYTVLGDAVNLGSRLEGITKEYGVRIVCSDNTKKQLQKPERFILRELDWIKVKGKNEPVTIFEVMRFKAEVKDKTLMIRDLFETGLAKYRKHEFSEAQSDFLKVLQISPQDGPASVFLERCEYFLENPVSTDWDGIWIMKSK